MRALLVLALLLLPASWAVAAEDKAAEQDAALQAAFDETLAAASQALAAQVITFETDPAGAASIDDAPLGLASAYTVGPLSIRFGFDGDLNGIPETIAAFEQAGPDVLDGFAACIDRDTAAPGFGPQLGNFFLRGNSGADFGVLATIDSPLSTQDSGCANTELDGKPWTFSFVGVPGIARITIDFIGTKTNGIGLAFNTFNATGEQPVPASPATWGRVKSVYR